jgi:hypothetical protein
VDGTSSELCLMVDFGINGVEPLGSWLSAELRLMFNDDMLEKR